MTKLVAVLGSVTPPGRLRRAMDEALERGAAYHGFDGTLIDLANVSVGFADGRPPAELGDDVAAIVEQISSADAVLFATPVYRGSLTGALKNLFDHMPVEALEAKPAAIATMGASDHHFLGAERHLRDVLAFFGALVAPVAVYLTSADFSDGIPSRSAADRMDMLVAGLLDLARATATVTRLGPRPLAAGHTPQ
jgi:FMN reductase